MTRWVTIENPGYVGEPRILKSVCHDRSNLLTIRCPWCGKDGHVHESQVTGVHPEVIVEIRCVACGNVSDAEMKFLQTAFEQMRADGWIQ